MNHSERQLLLSERTTLQELLKQSPSDEVICILSLQSRLAAVQALLDHDVDDYYPKDMSATEAAQILHDASKNGGDDEL